MNAIEIRNPGTRRVQPRDPAQERVGVKKLGAVDPMQFAFETPSFFEKAKTQTKS